MSTKESQGRYMDLKTDFAFKYVFSNENDKRMLISLLNEILKERATIVDIEYLLPEQLGNVEEERKAFFDLYCTNERGERFVIEMQIARRKNFIDRCLYYVTFPIQKQAIKGETWDYHLEPVFFIAIMDFVQWNDNPNYINYHSLINEETHEIISNKLQLVTIELAKFLKTMAELETELDRWLYCFKHLHELNVQPNEIQGDLFNTLFDMTEKKKLTHKNMEMYRKSVTEYADVRFAMNDSREEGYEQGIKHGIKAQNLQITKNLRKIGMTPELISDVTGLTLDQIRQIK
jgi:predicted transposase/invertase (TIGR01784 family)